VIALSSQTAAAIALHAAEGSWVVFLQTMPSGSAGPIKIEGMRGSQLAERLMAIARDNPYEVQLIGMLATQLPRDDAEAIAEEFAPYHIHDYWFEPHSELIHFIGQDAQSTLSTLLSQTHPGGLSDQPVDIDRMAEILDVSVPTVRRMIKANAIPYLKFGRIYRFVPNDVLASLRR
jgi:excisionase family DNA binding protein